MPKTLSIDARWRLGEADERACALISNELGLSRLTSRVLVRRGMTTPEEARRFLSPRLEDLPDPFSLPGMDKAAARIALALERGECISIFGDYDADGVAGSAVIADFLEACGGLCSVTLPRRRDEGYGITPDAVERLAKEGALLILTVDNGIGAVEAAARAHDLGIDLIITDHHSPRGEIPKAHAVVNPKLIAGDSPLKDLAGCGVAFMLALAVRARLRGKGMLPSPEPNLKRSLDLVALGTIADVVPLTHANRILVSFGLAEIMRCTRPGIRALLDVSSTAPDQVSPNTVAFRLAPRINAAGRIDNPMVALRLLRERSYAETLPMARALDAANRERQGLEEACIAEAIERISQDPALSDPGAIVIDSKGWHLGVIGIVASRLASRFLRPSVVISRETSPARGSARSFGGINILEALSCCSDLMVRFGGHAEAAGLNIDESRIAELRSRLGEACASMSANAEPAALVLDAVAGPADISLSLVEELKGMAPFGVGNPEPIIAMEGAKIEGRRTVGNGHLKLALSSGDFAFDAIGFGMAESMHDDVSTISIAFTPQFNTYNGNTSLQLKLVAIAPAAGH